MIEQWLDRIMMTRVVLPRFRLFGVEIFLIMGLVLAWCGNTAQAKILAQADFESGQVTEWTPFTTANGTFGGDGFPSLVDCDASGTGHSSKCWQVKVGQIQYSPDQDPQQGGGLEIRQELPQGRLRLSAQIMVTYQSPNDKRNLAGGLLEWVVNDRVVGKLDMGPIENGATLRHHLTADFPVVAGFHRIQLRLSRPFKSGTGQQAPVQSVDDLILDWSPPQEDVP